MISSLRNILKEKVLVLDGAMGTMLQSRGFCGNIDALCLTQPEIVLDIHRQYIAAGADILTTNSFNANRFSLEKYGLGHCVSEINVAAARLARLASGSSRLVVGSIGPMAKNSATYQEQAEALIIGGVDAIMIETITDLHNAKAAILGTKRAMREQGRELEIMLSVTPSMSGNLLSGHSLEAFIEAVAPDNPLSIGLNCGFGFEHMTPSLEKLSKMNCYVSLHPNAGLPDESGRYELTPELFARSMRKLVRRGSINIVGGCCGTTPMHIRKLRETVDIVTEMNLT